MDEQRPLIDRLLLARYFYFRGQASLREYSPFSAGFAICNFQDAAETFLRAVAEHLHCSIRETTSFNQLLDEIDNRVLEPLTYRSSLIQLNKARVNFKHFGLRPGHNDAEKFMVQLEAFFSMTAQRLLSVDFASISLASLIGHMRTENWLKKADQAVSDNEAKQAIESAAKAFAIFRRFINPDRPSTELDPSYKYESWEVRDLSNHVADVIDDLKEQLDLIMDGIDLSEYRMFRHLAPVVTLAVVGKVHLHWPHRANIGPSIEEAQQCIRFVIDSVLNMKANRIPLLTPGGTIPRFKLRVITDSPIVVYPEEDPEVIRMAVVGEVFLSPKSGTNPDGYVPIYLDDGDHGFIMFESIETLGHNT